MNSRFVLLLLSFCLSFSCRKTTDLQNDFQIHGKLENTKDSTLIFLKSNKLVDSTHILNGEFNFFGKVERPTHGILYMNQSRFSVGVWIENTITKINGDVIDLYSSRVNGGEQQRIANKLIDVNLKLDREWDSLNKYYAKNFKKMTEEERESLNSKTIMLSQMRDNNIQRFVEENHNTYPAVHMLNARKERWGKEKVNALFSLMNNDLKDSYYGKLIALHLSPKSNPQVGEKFVDFEQQNIDDITVKFSETKGKVTLIEFWASWCSPCVKEFPELKNIYRTYSKHGFEIVGVSLDDVKQDWLGAIQKYQLPWVNLTELEPFNNEAALIYHVNGIPDNVLIDEDGIIIGRKLDKDSLKSRLTLLFP